MPIVGVDTLLYGVADLEQSTRFFEDFGLPLLTASAGVSHFRLDEGSNVVLRNMNDPVLPRSEMVGAGVREVIWGVDTNEALEALVADLQRDRDIRRDPDGAAHFVADGGVPMGLRVFRKKAVVYAPDPVNAPGRVNRLNTHRKWRERARPKVIAHVVFTVPDCDAGAAFMQKRLHFRLTDKQPGFGLYLRCDGSNNHHNLLFLSASAPLPEADGKLRFHHANFGVEDIDEIMVGANHMFRKGWETSHFGLGRHRIDSALFFYLPCPAGGEAEYGADSDYVDDNWVPREWTDPLFAYSHFVHNLPPFLLTPPAWNLRYMTREDEPNREGQ